MLGWFDATAVASGWFDETTQADGWFGDSSAMVLISSLATRYSLLAT